MIMYIIFRKISIKSHEGDSQDQLGIIRQSTKYVLNYEKKFDLCYNNEKDLAS